MVTRGRDDPVGPMNDQVEEAFALALKKDSIFKDAKIFNPSYIPPIIQSRAGMLSKLSYVFSRLLKTDGVASIRLGVIGEEGVGKTLLVNHFCTRLGKIAEKVHKDLLYIYCNCYSQRTIHTILADIAITHFGMVSSMRGYSTEELLFLITQRLKRDRIHLILAVDNAHLLSLEELLLLNNYRREGISVANLISSVIIGRSLQIQPLLDSGLSNFLDNILFLSPYSTAEIRSILQWRIDHGFRRDSVLEDSIRKLCEYSSASGSVRMAIDTLRIAGEQADHTKDRVITPELIDLAWRQNCPTFKNELLDGLRFHELLVALAISRRLMHKGIITTSIRELYDSYSAKCNARGIVPRSLPTCRKIIQELERRGVVLMVIKLPKLGRGRSGRISVNFPPGLLKREVISRLKEIDR